MNAFEAEKRVERKTEKREMEMVRFTFHSHNNKRKIRQNTQKLRVK